MAKPTPVRSDALNSDRAIMEIQATSTAPTDRLMTIGEVAYRIGTSPSTVNRRIQAGKFPKPVHLGTRTSRWRESEVNAWIRSLSG